MSLSESNAFYFGHDAYLVEGKKLSDNPYPRGTYLFAAWEAGYLDAQSIMED